MKLNELLISLLDPLRVKSCHPHTPVRLFTVGTEERKEISYGRCDLHDSTHFQCNIFTSSPISTLRSTYCCSQEAIISRRALLFLLSFSFWLHCKVENIDFLEKETKRIKRDFHTTLDGKFVSPLK